MNLTRRKLMYVSTTVLCCLTAYFILLHFTSNAAHAQETAPQDKAFQISEYDYARMETVAISKGRATIKMLTTRNTEWPEEHEFKTMKMDKKGILSYFFYLRDGNFDGSFVVFTPNSVYGFDMVYLPKLKVHGNIVIIHGIPIDIREITGICSLMTHERN